MKQSIIAFFTAVLTVTACIPAFAADTTGEPLQEEVLTIGESPVIGLSSVLGFSETDIEKIDVRVEAISTGWALRVETPYSVWVGTKTMTPEYSFDGKSFLPVVDGWGDEEIWVEKPEEGESGLQRIFSSQEPMKSFAKKDVGSFCFRLKIEGDSYNGYSNEYRIERKIDPQPMPEAAELFAGLPASSEANFMMNTPNRGLFNVTLREGSSRETLSSYLPSELPVTVYLQTKSLNEWGGTRYAVNWKLPQGEQQDGTIPECAELVAPVGEKILYGVLANYRLPQLPSVTTLVRDPNNLEGFIYIPQPFDLEINMIPADEKISPQIGFNFWNGFDEEIMVFSLEHKASGAKSMVPEYSVDDGKTWRTVEREGGNDIIELGYEPDRVPKQDKYAAPLFFDNDKSPMKEYLEGSSEGFLIRFKIDGGVYDGISDPVAWPGNYDYSPPPFIDTDPDGCGGNRGDVGIDEGGNGGDRPGIINPEPNPAPEPDPTPEPDPAPGSEAEADPAQNNTKDMATDSEPKPSPKLDTEPPPPTSEIPAKLPETIEPISPEQEPATPQDSAPPAQLDKAVGEANPPTKDEPSATPIQETPAVAANAKEPSKQEIQPEREPGPSNAISPLTAAAFAVAAVAVVSGTIAAVSSAATGTGVLAKAGSMVKKLMNIFSQL